jgi:hypothetical protein
MHMFDTMYAGNVKYCFCVDADTAVSKFNTTKVRKAMETLDWLVGAKYFQQ